MNVYALFPLIATIVYIPLLLTTTSSRPWHKRDTLFISFLIVAMLWSLSDYFFRSDFFPGHRLLMFNITLMCFPVMAVQFYAFISTFFEPGRGRWLLFAYGSLAAILLLDIMGYVGEGYVYDNGRFFPEYGIGVLFLALPLTVLTVRSFYVFSRRLKTVDNPVLYNHILSLMVGLGCLTVFTVGAILPWGREFPISHLGNLLNGFILSYAVVKHKLIDIKIVLRKGMAWASLGVIGILMFWLALMVLHSIFDFQMDIAASLVATAVSVVVSLFIYKIRGYFFELVTRAFQGSSYDIRRRLNDFTDKIHNVFSLKEQGGELLNLLIKVVNVNHACLMFPEVGNDDYSAQFTEPKDKNGQLETLRLHAGNPIIKYLEREQKILSRENLSVLPAFLGMWPQEKEEIDTRDISMFVPLVSRERVISILVLGQKNSGRFTLEDFSVIEDVTGRVAVSMEKEYLREQLREREEELSVINNSSVILSSSLDIQEIFGSFIEELKKVIDVTWASIILLEENEMRCMALSTPEHSIYKVGDLIPIEGSGAGWVITQKKLFIEPDLQKDHYFGTGKSHKKYGLRTMVYLPLIVKGRAIGSFMIASLQPNAYTQRHIKLLEQLSSQIAMPLENTQLYARAEKKARIDELTGLLNRRSLDEMLDNEISRHSRYGGEFSLAILDLDSFKAYNDTYGHLSGDSLLREVGNSIKLSIRNADHAFRYGGDEFAIVLPQTDVESARQVAERVRKNIGSGIDTRDVTVTASIGIASWPSDGVSHTDIIAAADVTLYQAKREGGNQTLCASGISAADNLVETLAPSRKGKREKILDVARALAETIDFKSEYSKNHSQKVSEYSLSLGSALKMSTEDLEILQTSALLHDIGKIGISESILNKSGDLNAEEWDIMKTHSRMGAAIASNIPQISHCQEAILRHHEWFNGKGYPDGLKGDDIPVNARILAIADAFVAMTTDSPYAEALSGTKALEELKKNAGKQFDPELVNIFISMYDKKHTGAPGKVRG